MIWEKYKEAFEKKAYMECKSKEYIEENLSYAKILFDKDVPIIFSSYHLSRLLGYEESYIYSMSYSQKHFYRTFYINKKNGKKRKIDEPLTDLKNIQKWILTEILEKIEISKYAKAYQKNKSIKDNARFHRKQKIVLTIDLENFFPCIDFYKVYNVFKNIGYNDKVSALLSNLCTFNKSLPQGAPSSPQLSNIVLYDIDCQISKYTDERKIRYTRYADDMTFSGDFDIGELISNTKNILYVNKFKINKRKTRVARRNSRQEVTGIVVNEKMQISRSERQKIRQEIYYIKKYGIDSHLDHTNELRKNYIYHILGVVNHAIYINPYDYKMKEYFEFLKFIKPNNKELS